MLPKFGNMLGLLDARLQHRTSPITKLFSWSYAAMIINDVDDDDDDGMVRCLSSEQGTLPPPPNHHVPVGVSADVYIVFLMQADITTP